jgi:hypothetical protein
VKAFVRSRRVRRPWPSSAPSPTPRPCSSKGKLQDVNWRGQLDKRGVHIHHVGTVASYAATHHPELRLHRASKADWDAREARLLAAAAPAANDSRETHPSEPEPIARSDSRETTRRRGRGGFATNW